jgi:hypothetical protein
MEVAPREAKKSAFDTHAVRRRRFPGMLSRPGAAGRTPPEPGTDGPSAAGYRHDDRLDGTSHKGRAIIVLEMLGTAEAREVLVGDRQSA